MSNLGRAIAKVEFYDSLANINSKPWWQQFDLCGQQMKRMIALSKEMHPQNIDFLEDDDSWVAVMPSWIKTEFDNFLKTGEQTGSPIDEPKKRPVPRVEWSAKGIGNNLTGNKFWNKKLTLDVNSKLLFDSNGKPIEPKWRTSSSLKQQNKEDKNKKEAPTTRTIPANIRKIEQYLSKPDLLWGAETNFSVGSIPYIVEISTAEKMANKDGGLFDFLLISINKGGNNETGNANGSGTTNNNNCIDILLQNEKVYVCDWGVTASYDSDMKPVSESGDSSTTGPIIINTPLTYSSEPNTKIDIGILPCMGKLAIFSGNQYYVYKRIGGAPSVSQNTGDNQNNPVKSSENEMIPFVLKTDTVGVYGSNCSATVCIAAMEFLEAKCQPPLYGANKSPDGTSTTSRSQVWEASKDGDTSTDYYYFVGKGGQDEVGVSCAKFNSQTTKSIANQNSYFDPAHGEITVDFNEKAKLTGQSDDKVMTIKMFPTQPVTANGGDFYIIGEDGNAAEFPKCGPPFLFRLKGKYDGGSGSSSGGGATTTYNVMSFNQKYDSNDIFTASQSVDLTLYYDSTLRSGLDLLKKSYFVKVYFAWVGVGGTSIGMSKPFFTGVTLDSSISETAGKETINIHCEDFMRILQDNYLLNSPYYDGMYWYDSIKDVVKYAGITQVKNNAQNEKKKYYLPSGYTFQEPRMKFPPSQNIKDCVTEMVKMCERVVYFDSDGQLCCDYLQGGLTFQSSSIGSDIPEFYRDPSNGDKEIILDEKRTEKLIGSVVNQIFVVSIDRATSQPIVVNHTADAALPWASSGTGGSGFTPLQAGEITPPYRKILFFEQNAFGNLNATQEFVSMLAERVYKVPSKISIKTITDKILSPLTFFKVDGLKFRVSSSSINFNAEDNSLIANISGEWLGSEESQGD